ncbi:AraC family transcriptional regulator [Lachnospiraceae bacterium ZAX-1]
MHIEHHDIQYRYYEMPHGSPMLALLGSGWYRTYGLESDPLHFHNYMEIGFCYDGMGNMLLDEVAKPYANDFFTIIPANFLHNTIAKGQEKNRWEYLFIDVETFLNSVYTAEPQKAKRLIRMVNSKAHLLSKGENKEMAAAILQIMELYRDKKEMYIECAKGLLFSLLIRIAGLEKAGDNSGETASSSRVIAHALDYIWNHYNEEIQICDIAESCHMSETHFRRQFSESMHMAPLTYLNLVRVEAACKLLRGTEDSIQTIAAKSGFFTAQSFNRNFKDLMGVTPFKWRKDTASLERQLERQNIMIFNGWQ